MEPPVVRKRKRHTGPRANTLAGKLFTHALLQACAKDAQRAHTFEFRRAGDRTAIPDAFAQPIVKFD
jgi:hypothetical protein